MKNSDIALVVLLAAVSIAISYWLGNMILGDPSNDTYEVPYVSTISAEVKSPDTETFNPSGLNPTVEVIIGQCKEGETYDQNARKCVQKNSSEKEDKNDNDGNDGDGEENPENPEPADQEPIFPEE